VPRELLRQEGKRGKGKKKGKRHFLREGTPPLPSNHVKGFENKREEKRGEVLEKLRA